MSDSENGKFYTLAIDFVVDINAVDAPFKGKKDAPVTVAVFSDFQWPYCGKISPLLEQVLKQNEDTVKIVFKNLPLKNHDMAQPAAIAALAADKQGKFCEYHDKLFAEKKITVESFDKVAKELGMDTEQFKKDRASAPLNNHLKKDMKEAQVLGINGTPTVFVNGRKVKQRTITGFQILIDEELKKLQN